MKILPEAARCHVTRVSDGNRYVLEQAEEDVFRVVNYLPAVEIPERYQRFTRIGIVAAGCLTGFLVQPTMFLICAYWIWSAWRNGVCHHCATREEEEERDESEQYV